MLHKNKSYTRLTKSHHALGVSHTHFSTFHAPALILNKNHDVSRMIHVHVTPGTLYSHLTWDLQSPNPLARLSGTYYT